MTGFGGYDPNWQTAYADQVMSAKEAVKRIRPGQRVFIATGAGEPWDLVHALVDRAAELPDTEIVHLLTLGEAPYVTEAMAASFRVNSFFIAENVREAIQAGRGDYTPILLSDIAELFRTGQMPLDVALIMVAPPDAAGNCNLGVSVDIVKSAAENASLVIAQVNPNMPRVRGDADLHAYDLDCLVPSDAPLPEVIQPEPDPETIQIAENVASLVDDGSTLEFGIGKVPQALMRFLRTKKDLGIHTEMVSDGLMELMESGAVTGARKAVDVGKVVASFCLGSQKLYEYIHDNPRVSFHPTEYVNDSSVIAQHPRMVAVNTALEVDITGQVCADSLGARFYSGVGGQVDFNWGASHSRGGKAVIAIPSTARGGEVSRIVCHLTPGAGVVTTRASVHYVVTEYGVAYLHGKSVQERALALISVAHPDFRAGLLKEAIAAKYLAPEMGELEGRIGTGPKDLRTTMVLDDGTLLSFRPIHPTDEPRMRELYYALSQQTMYYRFMSNIRRLPRRQIQQFVYIDHRDEVAIVGTLPEASGDKIIAIGRYYLNPRTNRAEVAFTVLDGFQNRGIGTFLFQHLMRIARRHGIAGFTAEVLRENRAMQAVFNKSNCKLRSQVQEDVISYELDFT